MSWRPPKPPTIPNRALNSEFAPSPTKWMLVQYVVQLAVLGGTTTSVELRSDESSPPVTVRDMTSHTANGNDIETTTVQRTLRHLVPPGHKVKLVSTGVGATLTS